MSMQFFEPKMSSASKNIVAELNKGDKLNGDNYQLWAMKIQYVLEEQEVLETLTNVMVEPEAGNTAQHKRDREAYESWTRKAKIARITLLSAMDNDIMRLFRTCETAMDIWSKLAEKFGTISVSKLRSLTIKFDSYKKRPEHSMGKHLRQMANLISELKDAGHVLTDEQQVQAVIRSLPQGWDPLKMNLIHNETIQTLSDVSKHLELEEERLESAKPNAEVHMVQASSPQGGKPPQGGKKRKGNFKGNNNQLPGSSKKPNNKGWRKRSNKKKDLSKIKCFNCNKYGHMARSCTEQRDKVDL